MSYTTNTYVTLYWRHHLVGKKEKEKSDIGAKSFMVKGQSFSTNSTETTGYSHGKRNEFTSSHTQKLNQMI